MAELSSRFSAFSDSGRFNVRTATRSLTSNRKTGAGELVIYFLLEVMPNEEDLLGAPNIVGAPCGPRCQYIRCYTRNNIKSRIIQEVTRRRFLRLATPHRQIRPSVLQYFRNTRLHILPKGRRQGFHLRAVASGIGMNRGAPVLEEFPGHRRFQHPSPAIRGAGFSTSGVAPTLARPTPMAFQRPHGWRRCGRRRDIHQCCPFPDKDSCRSSQARLRCRA
jgi:hypothetical protein